MSLFGRVNPQGYYSGEKTQERVMRYVKLIRERGWNDKMIPTILEMAKSKKSRIHTIPLEITDRTNRTALEWLNDAEKYDVLDQLRKIYEVHAESRMRGGKRKSKTRKNRKTRNLKKGTKSRKNRKSSKKHSRKHK